MSHQSPLATLGPFRLLAKLGEGGMGEVWRAVDTRLGREVALKLLPERFASEPERLARFQREARALAALAHPSVAALFEVGEADLVEPHGASRRVHYLVMELAAGETLADRLARGALPVNEALAIAVQIAEGLEAAHERGIVHRDLKPANVAVDGEGRVKVLDFGLAKARVVEAPASASALDRSPTLAADATVSGTILGTAPYLSPEQARGQAVDERTDVWAFGCVLYELLSGGRAFVGETLPDLLLAIVGKEPDWSALPAATPGRVGSLLRRCLAKERRQRLRAIADARLELEEVRRDPAEGAPGATLAGVVAAPRARWPWLIAALGALIAAVAVGWALWRPATTPALVRLRIAAPPDTHVRREGEYHDLALAPDGQSLAFVAGGGAARQLWVRRLDRQDAAALPGTEGADSPFWSPDGRDLAFFADSRLRRVPAAGGAVQSVCSVAGANTGSWGEDGTILFTQVFASEGPQLLLVAASGGVPRPALIDTAKVVSRWPRWVQWLDRRRFLFLMYDVATKEDALFSGDLDSGKATPLCGFTSRAIYDPGSRRLLFVREGTLLAQPFDEATMQLRGEAIPLAENVPSFTANGWAPFAVAGDTLAYLAGRELTRLVWVDRTGGRAEVGLPADTYDAFALSPDGTRVVYEKRDDPNGNSDLWVFDLLRRVATRLTSTPGYESSPVWLADGGHVVFTWHGGPGAHANLWKVAASGAEPPRELLPYSRDWIFRWGDAASRDGRFLFYDEDTTATDNDIWRLNLATGERRAIRSTPVSEGSVSLSPDGRWMAYLSEESGRSEVYLMPADGGDRVQVSRGGGVQVVWRRADEILYLAPDGWVTSVPLRWQAGQPLLGAPVRLVRGESFDATADGSRLLVREIAADPQLEVVIGWQRLLRQVR